MIGKIKLLMSVVKIYDKISTSVVMPDFNIIKTITNLLKMFIVILILFLAGKSFYIAYDLHQCEIKYNQLLTSNEKLNKGKNNE